MGYAKLLKAALRYGGPQLGDALRRYQAQALDRPLSHERARQAHGADKAGGLRRYHHLAPVLHFLQSLLGQPQRPETSQVRSYKSPKGLATLTAAERRRCILGNIFADFYLGGLDVGLRYAAQLRSSGAARRPGRYGIWSSCRRTASVHVAVASFCRYRC